MANRLHGHGFWAGAGWKPALHAACVLAVAGGASARAGAAPGEPRPSSPAEIARGLARGAELRKQTQAVPNVVSRYALVMKAAGVRCGHATVVIEAAKGEAGATYRLTEQLKAAMAGEGESAVIDYSGTFLLGVDLALLSGQMTTHSKLSSKSEDRQQDLLSQAKVAVREDTLIWELTHTKQDGKGVQAPSPEKASGEAAGEGARRSKKFPLHGVRPIPKNAIFGIAAFAAAAAKDGWQLDGKESYCVPALDLGWEMDNFAVEPAWITFTAPGPSDPKGTAARMNVRWLAGEIEERGLVVDPPEPQIWLARQSWPLDAHCTPLAHPKPDEPRITAEAADPATLDVNAPLELEKIAAAMKDSHEKAQNSQK